MESITSDELQEWVDAYELAGAAKKAFQTFRQIMRWYLKTYRVRIYDETQGVEVPTQPRRKPCALSPKETVSSLREMRGEEWEPGALLQVGCGMRPCEAIACRWDDINLVTGAVRIREGLHEAFGNVYSAPPKTEKSDRVAYLPRAIVERLRAIKRERRPKKGDRLCDLRPSAYRRKVRAWFAKRGIRMCAQWLRHTWGTLAVQAGVKIETVALMLGHASLDTAYEHYLISNATLLKDAQRLFEEQLLTA